MNAVERPAAFVPGKHSLPGQVVLVLQGGGALGAYQAGVYEALHEAGIEPEWVIGTSIGAINAAIIAGNRVEDRLERLREFWRRVAHVGLQDLVAASPFTAAATFMTLWNGIEPFFRPNPAAFISPHAPLGAERAAYYSTAPLRRTLSDLIDFDRLKDGAVRLTVGAANVRTGVMRYFDSRDEALDLRHVMASGALPPAFPAVRIGNELFWDGGILSNTPVEAVFDDNPRRDSVVFAVHLWNADGAEPSSIWQVMNRQKDLQYASRASSHIRRQRQLHRLRHIVKELAMRLPPEVRAEDEVREMESYGCLSRMHVVRLLAPALDREDHTKDIDFSREGISARRTAGYEHARKMLVAEPWTRDVDPMEGLVLHESMG